MLNLIIVNLFPICHHSVSTCLVDIILSVPGIPSCTQIPNIQKRLCLSKVQACTGLGPVACLLCCCFCLCPMPFDPPAVERIQQKGKKAKGGRKRNAESHPKYNTRKRKNSTRKSKSNQNQSPKKSTLARSLDPQRNRRKRLQSRWFS